MKDKKIIFHAFNGKLVGNKYMQKLVCETLSKMSWDIIEFVTKNCWFISSMDDAWAFTLTGNDLKDQHLIFLSEDLLDQHPAQIYMSIAHEIGHVILGHRNSILERQSKEEIKEQERQADKFVEKLNF